ncbi:MAG: glucosamine-6-phosphate deaminase [Treponema sp.]|jgi:glucosamine-6-phosphate deaminase|nr:glucosamine-6-phosphate deaminase [Treponema sp.]
MFFTRQAIRKPDTFFALATGDTTKGMYTLAAALHRDLGVDYSSCKTCNLDEYAGLPAEDKHSCRYRINDVLLNRINIKMENTYVPDGLRDPPEKEIEVFRETIERFGGIDLLILGVGNNGHIGFNEPGTPFDSGFRVAPISQNTRKDKSGMFGGSEEVPRFGITMGIRDIMMAREILLLAKGKNKAAVVCQIVRGPLTEDVPATVLRLHPALTIMVDGEAASRL